MLTKQAALLALLLLSARIAFAEDPAEELLAAARKGDVTAVRALLDKGVDVNSKNRYGATALSYACDRGNLELVTLLIERGADVNATDTFYKASPITWATMNGHADVIKLLLAKGAKGADSVLMAGVGSKDAALVKVALDKGGIPQATLSAALASATRQKETEIIEMLKKAGAESAPTSYKVDVETLKSYEGSYKAEDFEMKFTVREGSLTGSAAGRDEFTLVAVDKTTFSIAEFEGMTVAFSVEGGKVTSVAIKRGDRTTILKKVEQK
jgi:hypothetical protein